jgi:hypothetical protein
VGARITVALFAALTAAANIVLAQASAALPRFEDYPVSKIFTGKPAPPILVTAQEKMYRTRIREGVKTGQGILRDGKAQPGPNFAGHYIFVTWGCGSECGMAAIVDAITGRVYNPPLSPDFLLPLLPADDPANPDYFVPSVAELEFRPNSKLMIVKANPNQFGGRAGYAYYLLWQDNRWRLLRRVPLPPRTN